MGSAVYGRKAGDAGRFGPGAGGEWWLENFPEEAGGVGEVQVSRELR